MSEPPLSYFRDRIAVQANHPTRDTDGAEIDNWTTQVEAWASIEPLIGREYWGALSTQAELSHKIRMRYRAGIAPAMRILFGARVFDILSVKDVGERRRELVLMCSESL